MKKLDIRSVLIGVLATTLVFVLIGAKSQNENLGDIVVNSINVLDENGNLVATLYAGEDGGQLGILNADGNTVATIAADEDGGVLGILNADGNPVAGLVAVENGGILLINNNDGKTAAGLIVGEYGGIIEAFNYNNDGNTVARLGAVEKGGALETFNTHNKSVGYFGSSKDSDGIAILSDRYGDDGWAVSGKQ